MSEQSRSVTKAARSQGAPGQVQHCPRRGQEQDPRAFRCCRRRTRGFGCKVCLGEREGAPVRGAEPRAARAGRLALALHCPEPPLGAQAGAMPCAERAATALLLASLAPPSHLPFWLAPPVAPIPRVCLQAVALRAGAVADAGLAKPVSPSDAHSAACGTARHFIILLETHTAPAQLEPRVLAINMLCPD